MLWVMFESWCFGDPMRQDEERIWRQREASRQENDGDALEKKMGKDGEVRQ
jgi:hypothetical protein